jgi:outer membrane protein
VIAWLVAAQVLAAPITLEEVRAASRDNLTALQAELEVARSEAAITTAKSVIYPQLSMRAQMGASVYGARRSEYSSDGTPTPDVPAFNRGNFSLGLTINQLLYDGGRWWNQISQSGAASEAAKGQLEEQRLASQFEAERRFFELLRAQQALAVLKQTVDRSQQQLERAKSLFEAGRGQKRDALDAEVNLGNDEIQVIRSQQAIVASQVDLLNWLARPTAEIEAVAPQSLTGVPAKGPEAAAALATARAHRPLLKALASQQRASQLTLEVAHAAYLPRVSASVGYDRSSAPAAPFFIEPDRQNALSFGLLMQWDIFSGFATQAQVSRASTDLRATELQQTQAERELEGEIRRTSAALEAQLKIATLAERNRSIAEVALRLAEERFNAGAGSTLEVRDAQIKLTQTQLTQVQGRIDVEIARASLGRIVGAPL